MRMMSSALAMIAICMAALEPAPASAEDRFVEFHVSGQTRTYDLSTVEMIAPGRFTISETSIDDDPDAVARKVRILDTIRKYCDRPVGKYFPTARELGAFGPPDQAVEAVKIEHVRLAGSGLTSKVLFWHPPYKALDTFAYVLHCEDKAQKDYIEYRSMITNGIREKELFDCKRAMVGLFSSADEDDKAHAFTFFVIDRLEYVQTYFGLCRQITGSDPYPPG